jgi:DNA end-binding protein Ku
VKLAQQVIGTFEGDLDIKSFHDTYQEALRTLIDAKVAGEDIVETAEEAPAKVVDLMEALRRSLETVSAGKKTPAKATLGSTRADATAKKPRKRASA